MHRPIPAAGRAALVLSAALVTAPLALGVAIEAHADPVVSDSTVTQNYAYQRYLSQVDPLGYSTGWGDLYRDKSYDGSPLSLLMGGQEQTFEHGLWAHASSTITYTDIQEYGYERFESWVGVGNSARVSGKSAQVVFKVIGDGQELWSSSEMTERSDAKFVSVDISNVKVLQLVVEATDKANHPHNHTIWGDAAFYKKEASPWLSASDKTFTNPDQVTKANILEGVFARTLSGEVGATDQPVSGPNGTLRNGKEGNDLTDDVTYETDYVEGRTGEFTITYHVTDAQGIERTRTVTMTVQGEERYRLNADLDYLTTPFASYLYTGRDYFDEQGKRAFDLCADKILDFGKDVDGYQIVNRNGEQVYALTVNLQDAGIYMSASDAMYLCSTIMDDEPRAFHVKDWGTDVSKKDGMANTATFYVPVKYGQRGEDGQVFYHTRLMQIEENSSRFLANIQDGMTDSQRLRAVLYPYADWLRYGNVYGQTMEDSLAVGLAVCGGNARGSVYLSQRMGIKAYWVRTGSHAWSNVKLNHDDSGRSNGAYYRVDLLARPGCFLSIDANHEGYHGHHKEIFFNRAKGYPDATAESYPFEWTAWPKVTLDVEDSWVVLAPEDKATFDASKLIESASSIYDGNLVDNVQIDYGFLYKNATDDAFKDGYYELTYSVSDTHGNSATATVNVQVVAGDVIKANAENCQENVNSSFVDSPNGGVSLWNGSGEVVYSHGIAQNDGGKSVTYAVDRGNDTRLTYLDAWVGMHKSTRDSPWGGNGKVRFLVKATVKTDGGTEEITLYTSPDMTRYTVQQHVLVAIPENALTVTLTSESLGSGNGHARWGNPRFFTNDILSAVPVAPSISEVEDGATYDAAVTPQVSDASTVSLYRKNLPVIVDTETGLPSTETLSEVSSSDSSWGELVADYRTGSAIGSEGVYTLVAENQYRKTIVRFTIEKNLVRVADPQYVEGLTYSASPQVGVPAGDGYTLSCPSDGAAIDASGNAVATGSGTYTVIASLQDGHVWLDGTKAPKTIGWTVSKATLVASYPGEAVAQGTSPSYAVEVTGFVGGESASTAAGFTSPSIADADKPSSLEAGTRYTLTPTGGSADNYQFEYVSGSLTVGYTPVAVPSAATGLVANGSAQVGVPAAEGYALSTTSEGAWIDESGNAVAAEAGTYVALAHPTSGHVWENGSFDLIEIEWTVAPPTPSNGGNTGGNSGGNNDGNTGSPAPDVPGTGDEGNGEGNDVTNGTTPNGTTVTVDTAEDGSTTSVTASVSEKDAAAGSITLPMESVTATDAPSAIPVTVKVPGNATVAVTIPVSTNAQTGTVSPGDVLVRVNADGTETVMPKTGVTKNGLVLDVSGEVTLKVVNAATSFPDVTGNEWFAEEVAPFASSRGLISGVVLSNGTAEFQGGSTVNRGMLVTMLHRLELQKAASDTTTFPDVASDAWFSRAAAWGKEAGVISGYDDGTFGGADLVTREQIATFCFRYANSLGLDTSARADLTGFADSSSVSGFASDALSWAVATGLVKGDDATGTLRPTDGATRAEAAAVVMRLVNSVIN